MAEVLHVFDASSDAEDIATRDQLLRANDRALSMRALLVGHGQRTRDVFQTARAIRRHLPDVVHAWGAMPVLAAGLAGVRSIVLSDSSRPSPGVPFARAIGRFRDVRLVCRCPSLACEWPGATVIEPAVESADLAMTRVGARRQLGLADDDVVLLAMGESTRAADHPAAVWATGVLNVLDRRTKLLLWGRGNQAAMAVKLAGKMRQGDMVIVAEHDGGAKVPWATLVAAADVALSTARGPVATLPIAECLTAGLPIIATRTASTSAIVSRRVALLIDSPSPRTLARCVLDVLEQPEATAMRTNAGRAFAASRFAVARLQQQYVALYRSLLRPDAADEQRAPKSPSPGVSRSPRPAPPSEAFAASRRRCLGDDSIAVLDPPMNVTIHRPHDA